MQQAKKALEDVTGEDAGDDPDETDKKLHRLPRMPYHVSYSRYLRNREQGLFTDRIAIVGFYPSDYVSGEALITGIHSMMHKYVLDKEVGSFVPVTRACPVCGTDLCASRTAPLCPSSDMATYLEV